MERPGLLLVGVLALLFSVFILLAVSSGLGSACNICSINKIRFGRSSLPAGDSNVQVNISSESWQPYASSTAAASARNSSKAFPTDLSVCSRHPQLAEGVCYFAQQHHCWQGVAQVCHQRGHSQRNCSVTGWVSMFYLALLSNRAITTTFKDPLPGFEAACDMPYINWTQPFAYPDGALDLADLYYKGMSENNPERYFPNEGLINSTMYNMTYVVNQAMEHGTKFGFFHDQNLTNYPPSNSEVPYVIAASNRGQTYKLALNPYHRQQLWSFGLTPETAYMCGFFYLCSPNTAVQELYKPYWEALSRPGLLKIGIMVRVGDSVFQGNAQSDNATAIQLVDGPGDVYFRCAAAFENAYRVPGQEVVWYLMSDSLGFSTGSQEQVWREGHDRLEHQDRSP